MRRPWGDRIYLTGGLAPRYLITELPEYARPHVGTTDVDLVVGVAVIEQGPEPYATLVKNMMTAGFRQYKDAAGESASFRWCIGMLLPSRASSRASRLIEQCRRLSMWIDW